MAKPEQRNTRWVSLLLHNIVKTPAPRCFACDSPRDIASISTQDMKSTECVQSSGMSLFPVASPDMCSWIETSKKKVGKVKEEERDRKTTG